MAGEYSYIRFRLDEEDSRAIHRHIEETLTRHNAALAISHEEVLERLRTMDEARARRRWVQALEIWLLGAGCGVAATGWMVTMWR